MAISVGNDPEFVNHNQDTIEEIKNNCDFWLKGHEEGSIKVIKLINN